MTWERGTKKPLNFKFICIICGKKSRAADYKAKRCRLCCTVPIECACGCGGMARARRWPCIQGHASRIDSPQMRRGHKAQARAITGKGNPSKKKSTRKKLTQSLTRYWAKLTKTEKKERTKRMGFVVNPMRGRYKLKNGYRSKLETTVASVLEKWGESFDYEPKGYKFKRSRFYPDFVLDDGILLEVSGYAYPSWKDQFDKKIRRILRRGYSLVCLTYAKNVKEMKSRNPELQVFSIRSLKKWLSER